ncbi:MAG: HAMP domain-containing sensor histidine kinase [Candidatus Eisenbacteria bacterium]
MTSPARQVREVTAGPLRRRLALALAALAAASTIGLSGVYFIAEYLIEATALRSEMTTDLNVLIRSEERARSDGSGGTRSEGADSVPLEAEGLRYFTTRELPSELRDVPSGTFQRMQLDGHTVQILTDSNANGELRALVKNLRVSERRERSLVMSLIGGVLVAAAAAWWISGGLARRILTPLTRLVGQIHDIDPLHPAGRPVKDTGDRELDAIPDAVNALVHELDHVLQRERAFIDAASHELRTPLAVIRGGLDVLRERGDAPAPVLERLERAACRAQDDLVALLALSPAREPEPPREVDLRSLLPNAAEPYLREAIGGRIEQFVNIDVDPEPGEFGTSTPPSNAGLPCDEGASTTHVDWVWGDDTIAWADPATLSIVFTNLLRNALRAAPHGRVRIEASARALRILDDGEGLPEGWPDTGEPRGRGLGLPIARILAERHGWRVEVGPHVGGGTEAALYFV